MRIDGLGGSAPAMPASRGRRSKAGFAVLIEPDGTVAAEAAGAGSIAPAPGAPAPSGQDADLLARDREARRHGAALLDALASLQASLLGGVDAPAIERLAALTGTACQAADPGLQDALAAIALRAVVELAKRG